MNDIGLPVSVRQSEGLSLVGQSNSVISPAQTALTSLSSLFQSIVAPKVKTVSILLGSRISPETSNKPERLKSKVKAQIAKEAISKPIKKEECLVMLAELRKASVGPPPLSKEAVQLDFFKIAAHKIAYSSFEIGERINSPGGGIGDYEVSKPIANKRGLQIVVLKPLQPGDPPILCCRGTNAKNLENIIDDLGRSGKVDGIGQYSYEISEEEIKDTIAHLSSEHGKVVVSGHSLGGAIAQIITTHSLEHIDQAVLCSSPGVGDPMSKLFKEKKTELLSRGERAPVVTDIRHRKDIIFNAGGARIEADVAVKVKTEVKGLKRAHSNSGLISSLAEDQLRIARATGNQGAKTNIRVSHRIIAKLTEASRTSSLGKIATDVLHKKAAKKTAKAMKKAKTVASGMIAEPS